MDSLHRLSLNEVVDALDPVLQRLGFYREKRGLHVVEDDGGDDIIASWLREPPTDGIRPDRRWWAPTERRCGAPSNIAASPAMSMWASGMCSRVSSGAKPDWTPTSSPRLSRRISAATIISILPAICNEAKLPKSRCWGGDGP